jgi:hypothetical protein
VLKLQERRALAAAALALAALAATRRLHVWGRLNAWVYDAIDRRAEERFLGRARAEVLAGSRGRVLEVGAGTGANFRHYPKLPGLEVVAVDQTTPCSKEPETRQPPPGSRWIPGRRAPIRFLSRMRVLHGCLHLLSLHNSGSRASPRGSSAHTLVVRRHPPLRDEGDRDLTGKTLSCIASPSAVPRHARHAFLPAPVTFAETIDSRSSAARLAPPSPMRALSEFAAS